MSVEWINDTIPVALDVGYAEHELVQKQQMEALHGISEVINTDIGALEVEFSGFKDKIVEGWVVNSVDVSAVFGDTATGAFDYAYNTTLHLININFDVANVTPGTNYAVTTLPVELELTHDLLIKSGYCKGISGNYYQGSIRLNATTGALTVSVNVASGVTTIQGCFMGILPNA